MLREQIVQAVKEMMERHWDVYTIASRLKIDIALIQSIIDNLLT